MDIVSRRFSTTLILYDKRKKKKRKNNPVLVIKQKYKYYGPTYINQFAHTKLHS